MCPLGREGSTPSPGTFSKILLLHQSIKIEKALIATLIFFILFGYLYNLGLIPQHADESIRSTVAHEMMISKNYIVPTVQGEYYYKKPPLYNWLLIGVFKLTGSFSDFVFRLPSVIPLFLFGVTIWLVSKKTLGNRVGLLAGFSFILCGRMLIYSSLLGHIDIFYSWITFIGFFSIYHFYEKRNWWMLFIVSYFLAALGVLMKGLPSFLFQGLTLLSWFIYKRSFKQLFKVQHLLGLLLFAAIVGGYFYAYSKFNHLLPYLEALYDQSSQRTVVEKSWYDSIVNIFTFPLENLFIHLMPTALVFIFCIQKRIFKRWWSNDFTAFVWLTFLVNIPPYWLSPGYYPRYLFMLYPLLFILGSLAYYENREKQIKYRQIFEWIFGIAGIVLSLSFLAPIFLEDFKFMSNRIVICLIMCIVTGVFVVLHFKLRNHRIYTALIFIALFRIGFDSFVLTHRFYVERGITILQKEYAEEIVSISGNNPVYIKNGTPVNWEYNFYIGSAKNQIISQKDIHDAPGAYFITLPKDGIKYELDPVYKFRERYRNHELWLVKTDPVPGI